MLIPLLLLICAASVSAEQPGQNIAFTNVRVLTMTEAGTLASATVMVSNGQIHAVTDGNTALPDGYRVIDGKRKTLMPGLADMHVHYWREDIGPVFIANGITTVRNLWGTNQSIRLDESARRHVATGPHVYSSGPLMDGPEPIWGDDSVVLTSPEQAVGAVESQKKSGYMAVKLYEGLTPDIYRAAVKAAKEREMQVWSHTPHGQSVNDLIDLQIDSLEHFNDVQDVLRPPEAAGDWFEEWAAAEEAKMKSLAERFASAGVWNSPTLSVIAERYRLGTDPDAFFSRPEAEYVPPGIAQWWRESASRMKPYDDRKKAARSKQLLLLKTLHEAGAPLLLGTDTPNPFVLPGFSIHGEIAAWREAGIPMQDILRIATADAAKFLGEEGQWGAVKDGARADLLLLDGDPLRDAETLRKPAGVMMNGRWLDRSGLRKALEEAKASLQSVVEEP